MLLLKYVVKGSYWALGAHLCVLHEWIPYSICLLPYSYPHGWCAFNFSVLHTASNLKGVEDPHYFMQRVGEYDMWAIKYGYMAVEGEETLTQHEVRKKKAQKNGHTKTLKSAELFRLFFLMRKRLGMFDGEGGALWWGEVIHKGPQNLEKYVYQVSGDYRGYHGRCL